MRATACFSMYSDMSSRTMAFSSSNRNSARARAVSVFPTPVGPRKMNEPVGRFGSCRPARARRAAAGGRLLGLGRRLLGRGFLRLQLGDGVLLRLPLRLHHLRALA